MKASRYSRRDFLRLGWTIGAGLVVPSALSGCSDDGGSQVALPEETFVQPPILESVAGLLSVTLRLAYLPMVLNGKAVTLRAMNDRIPAPTLRIKVGDTLRILVDNQLPPNPPSVEPVQHLRYPNSTNLHTHGLHVTPGLVAAGVYGDYVVDDPKLGIQPGQIRQHEYRIGLDHPPGAYWYHPHLHGSTAIQVGGGMAGALIIKGDIDRVPEIAAASERIFVFQAPISDATGMLESFTQVADSPGLEGPFLINGVRRPRIVMQRGEVQNWHFVNAAIFNFVNLGLDDHALNVYSHDGNPRRTMLAVGPEGQNGVVLAPGNRASVLVQAGAPGTYQLRTLRFQMGTRLAVLEEDVLADVVVVDPPLAMRLPTGPLPVPPGLAPITDEELASAGGLNRIIVLRSVFNDNEMPITDPPASEVAKPGDELSDWIFQTGKTTLANKVFAFGTASGQASTTPGLPTEYIPYQSRRAIKQTVALGAVEEWTLLNMNPIRHPFHMHVNPFEVVKINGAPIEPYWADTIGLPNLGSPTTPTSVTFRIRFRDYAGLTVMHCHMLTHEDMGMMQAVEIV